MTKSEKIFKNTKCDCRKYIKDFGFKNIGLKRMSTNEIICKRTYNDIMKLINIAYKHLTLYFELKIISDEEYKNEYNTIKMVEITLKNSYIK